MAATLNEYEAQNAKSVVRLGTHSVKTLVNSSLAAIEAYAVFSNPFQSKSSLLKERKCKDSPKMEASSSDSPNKVSALFRHFP